MESEPKWFRLALKVAWKRSRLFCQTFPVDLQQAARLAAIEVESLPSERIPSALSRLMYRAIRDYGFYRPTNGQTMISDIVRFEVNGDLEPKNIKSDLRTSTWRCGVPRCGQLAIYKDTRLDGLCNKHYKRMNRQRRNGAHDPYEGIDR